MINKDFYTRAKELADKCQRVKGNKVYETLALEFNIGKRAAGDRFKSIFRIPVGVYISKNITPTKIQMRDAIIRSETYAEMLKILNINSDLLKGLYDKYFGYSTFFKVKSSLLNEVDIVQFDPTIEDNLGILISQHLGDGYFEFYSNRDNLKIEHGSKQFCYLKFKVSLINTIFPLMPGLETIKKRETPTFTSYYWRSHKIRSRYINIIKNTDKKDLVSKLTPFGWFLYFLDDGYLGNHYLKKYNSWNTTISISSVDNDILLAIKQEMATYGITFGISRYEAYTNKKSECIKFMQNFVYPFQHLIPECMKYKSYIKI